MEVKIPRLLAEKSLKYDIFQTLRVHYSGKLVVLRLLSPFEVDFKMSGVHQPR